MNTTTIVWIVILFILVDVTTDALILKRMGYSPMGLLRSAWAQFKRRPGFGPKPVPVTYNEPEWDEEEAYYEDIHCDCEACRGQD